ncbi:MAG: ATP synthase F1 subunit delta [Candidatus Carbobacillus sp.]|nr:ATP synthase F1 subunit delta [Candidatus Carbobacillus sp.]
MNERLARRYALALIESYKDNEQRMRALSDMKALLDYLNETPQAWEILTHPLVKKRDKQALLQALAKTFDAHMQTFLRLVFDRDRLNLIHDIGHMYERLLNERTGHRSVDIYAARPLAPDVKETIRKAVETYVGRAVELNEKIDPNLLGGFVLTIDDLRFDGSIRGTFERLRSVLVK